MSAIAEPVKTGIKPWVLIGFISGAVLLAAVLSAPNLLRVSQGAQPLQRPEFAVQHDKSPQLYSAMQQVANSAKVQTSRAEETAGPAKNAPDRKIVRTSSLQLIVGSPAQAAEKIRLLAEGLGGYLESAQIGGSQDAPTACISIRVPAVRLEEAKAEIRKLAGRVESEKTDARDVTKEYVDMEARLHNLRAQEAQYLQIMKSATKVKDMLDVSENLSEVRGEIEQEQAEFAALSKQVETAAIAVSLRAEVQAQARVFGFNWRPLYQLKLAAHDALDGVADYVSIITSVILYLPVVVLWVGTIVLGTACGWRVLRWGARVFFAFPRTNVSTTPVS